MDQAFSTDAGNQIFVRCVQDCAEPIMITDRKGELRYVNTAWSSIYGYSSREAIGETPRLLRSEDHSVEFYASMWSTILNSKLGYWKGEVVNKAKDGHLVPVLLTITPYRDFSGEPLGYMGIAVDLTEQKKMEHQLLRQDRLVSIGLLAGGLAHEIGNPLGVIQGRAELLLKDVVGNIAAEKNVAIIVSQIDRISNLIQSLLRVSRVPDVILLRDVKLQPVIDEVELLMSEPMRRFDIELRQRIAVENVFAEPTFLQQLFLNLIINAVHAIEEQKSIGPTPLVPTSARHFIEIEAVVNGESTEISFTDSGCGISKETIKKLFQPFFTTKPAGKGTGMGLAIAAKIVDEMHGQIDVSSEGFGQGARFKISLPNVGLVVV